MPRHTQTRIHPNGKEGVGGDDAADALKYLVASRTRSISQKKLTGF
jgi:hypothetical protein